ncbi:hypothetical protein X231_1820 [Streptococcus pneumoniae ECC_3510]|nr:hypothetical protein X231_1820 [Streptococcus pneumoniae ECC_3510]
MTKSQKTHNSRCQSTQYYAFSHEKILFSYSFKIKKGIYRFTDMYITDFYRSCIDRISSLGSFPF